MNLGPGVHASPRPDWLAGQREYIIDPSQPIIDAHHHLWEAPGRRTYLYKDLIDDIAAGHNIRATVFTQCRTHYLTHGPEWMRPVGEVEFASRQAELAAVDHTSLGICSAIVAHADLRNVDVLPELLDRESAAAGGRLRGIRHTAAWHPELTVAAISPQDGKLLLEPAFQEGLKHLEQRGLVYESWLVHTQIDELAAMAGAHPELTIVLDHLGGPLAIGPYQGRRKEVFVAWSRSLRRLAGRANVRVKIGGFGMKFFGFDFDRGEAPPTSRAIAEVIRPYVRECIEAFGTQRCMFESNFPVDKSSFNYHVVWNAYKRVVEDFSPSEKNSLFYDTAAACYRLPCRDHTRVVANEKAPA